MGYVVSFAGRRDSYQVPIALAEFGMLDALCTDFYFNKKSIWQNAIVPKRFRRRHAKELDINLVYSSALETIVQSLSVFGAFELNRIHDWLDSDIGRRARAIAVEKKSDVLSYSNYALESFSDPQCQSKRKILFMYHPHYKAAQAVLMDDYQKYNLCKWSIEREFGNKDQIEHQRLRNNRIDAEISLADHIICASSFTRTSVQESGFFNSRSSVVPYGCYTQEIAFDPSKKLSSRSRFLFVGQGVQRKGLHHLFLAWQKAQLKDAVLDVVLSVADPGIISIAPDNVIFHQSLAYGALVNLFQSANAFVMPSLIEGFGLVYLEALSAGCYCIYTPNTGVPDICPPIDVAIETPTANVEALTEALIGVHAKVQNRQINPHAIRRFAELQTWARFREGIVAAVGSQS